MSNSEPSSIQTKPEFRALKVLSAHLGADPLLVQGPGGNTSIKHDGVLWIKASGTWLKNACTDDLFVPVAIEPLLDAVDRQLPSAEKSIDFICQALNPSGLRPSIETTVHALLPFRVVLHVHCVNTIALAVRQDAQTILSSRLHSFNWSWIPYVRPGLPLARMIQTNRRPDSNVLILGNHGLVVGADTVSDAQHLLQDVVDAVQVLPRTPEPTNVAALKARAVDTPYRLPAQVQSHATGCDAIACAHARGGSLYPDHVIFLGEGTVVAKPEEAVQQVLNRVSDDVEEAPVSIVLPACGTLMRNDASAGQEALAQCLADVCLRIPEGAVLNYLSDAETYALMNWEAEQYRQQLEKARTPG